MERFMAMQLVIFAMLILKEHCSVYHPVKKVLLCTTLQLLSYIKITINSVYCCSRIDGYRTPD